MVDIEDIDVGALPDDGNGDPERDAFKKTNAIAEALRQHRADNANPHGTTAEQVGTYSKATIETKLADLKVEVQTGTVSPAQLAEILKGVVVASASGSITLVEGAARTLTLTETARSAFEPGTFAALTRKASVADYAVIRPTAYDPGTGVLAFTIEKAVGGAGPFTDWEVASLAGPTVAQLALLAQGYAAQAAAEAARDLARDWATKTTAEVAPGLGFGAKKYAQDAAGSATTATNRAADANTAANRAETAASAVDGTAFVKRDGSQAMLAKLPLAPSAAGRPALNIPAGTDPSAPVEGDIWYAGSGALRGYVSGAIHRVAWLGLDQAWNGHQTFNRPIRLAVGATSASPADGDLRVTADGLFVRFGGVEQQIATVADLAAKPSLADVHALILAR